MNKSITQQMHEAFLKSQENGMNICKSLQERYSSMERDIDRGRNATMKHLNENDRGFYIPQSEHYKFGLLDGDHIKRRSLIEQNRDPYYDLDPEDRAWVDNEMEKRTRRKQQVVNARLTGINPESDEFAGRRNEADVRSQIDPTAPGAQDAIRRAQVQDKIDSVRGTRRSPQQNTSRRSGETEYTAPDWDEIKRKREEEKRKEEYEKFGYSQLGQGTNVPVMIPLPGRMGAPI